MTVIRAAEEKVNPVCAIGSVAAAVGLLFVVFVVVAFILFSLGISTESWPRFPRAVGLFCDAWTIGFVAFKLYPKCMKARIARRLSHG